MSDIHMASRYIRMACDFSHISQNANMPGKGHNRLVAPFKNQTMPRYCRKTERRHEPIITYHVPS